MCRIINESQVWRVLIISGLWTQRQRSIDARACLKTTEAVKMRGSKREGERDGGEGGREGEPENEKIVCDHH